MSFTSRHFLIPSCLIALAVLTMSAVTSPVVRRQRSDDGGPLEVVVEHLSQQFSSLSAQLTAQAAQIAALNTKTAILDKTVAFHAWGSTNPVQATALGNVILNHAATNIGNAYDTLTGVFTAPVSGLYDFQASIVSYDLGADKYVHGAIYVNDAVQAFGISDNRHGFYGQATFKTVVHVKAGQKVYVKNTDNRVSQYYDSLGSPHTTFSGFLIKAD